MSAPQQERSGVLATTPRHLPCGGVLAAIAVLLLTAVLSLYWSHQRLMWNDEFLSFHSDSVATLASVLHVQWHAPISLDPPTYHLLSHLAMQAIGRNAIALRLPALAGFLLLELCVFLLVRMLAGRRAGLVAMVLPLCTASFRYSVEGRPYGLLLGLYAASLLCWFIAARHLDAPTPTYAESASPLPHPARREWGRALPLVGLFLSIAFAITSHYFGVLILLPVSIGEAVRSMQRRRFDWPVVATLAAGLASVALILPGKAALAPYQRHYYTGNVNLHNVSQGYREIFIRYNTWPMGLQRITAAALALATLALLWGTVRRFRNRPATEPAYLWAALLALAVLPFFGFLFGKFVTHTMEVRYVMAALIAFAVSIALLMERLLRSREVFLIVMGTLVVFATLLGVDQARSERLRSNAILAGMAVPASLHEELATHPDERLYTQSLGDFFLDNYYAADPLVRQRITLVYDEPLEVQWLGHNTNAVTAVNLQQFSPLPITRYSNMLAERNALLLDYGSGWEWVSKDLRARDTPEHHLGSAAGATLVRLNPTTR